jgi:hypothetical protein
VAGHRGAAAKINILPRLLAVSYALKQVFEVVFRAFSLLCKCHHEDMANLFRLAPE